MLDFFLEVKVLKVEWISKYVHVRAGSTSDCCQGTTTTFRFRRACVCVCVVCCKGVVLLFKNCETSWDPLSTGSWVLMKKQQTRTYPYSPTLNLIFFYLKMIFFVFSQFFLLFHQLKFHSEKVMQNSFFYVWIFWMQVVFQLELKRDFGKNIILTVWEILSRYHTHILLSMSLSLQPNVCIYLFPYGSTEVSFWLG